MSKIFQQFIVFFVLISMYGLPSANCSEEKVGENLIKQKVKKIGDGSYSLDFQYNEQPISFVYEQITEQNWKFWGQFAGLHYNWGNRLPIEQRDLSSGLLGASLGLTSVLKRHTIANVCVAYFCTQKIESLDKEIPEGFNLNTQVKSKKGCAGFDNIEMVVGVVTSKEVPFYTTMGIMKSHYRRHHKLTPQLKYLSPLLQGSVAFMQEYLYSLEAKTYMVNQPLRYMRGLLIKNFPNNIYVGDNENLKIHQAAIEREKKSDDWAAEMRLKRHQEIVDQQNAHPSVISIDDQGYLNLSKDEEVIWTAKSGKCYEEQVHWFFQVANTSNMNDPYVAIDAQAIIKLFLSSVTVAK